MKIAYRNFNELLTLKEGEAYKICIEDVCKFRGLIEDLLSDMNEGTEFILLSEKDKELKMNKASELIIDPFNLDINQRKVLLRLYTEMQDLSVNEVMFDKTLELKRCINEYLLDLEMNSKYVIQHDMNFEMKDIFNAVKLKMDEEGDTLLEKIAAYVKEVHIFLGIKVFWFVGLNAYLGEEEIYQLLKEASYQSINIIMLESRVTKRIGDEKIYILDKDHCVIHCDN